MTHLVLLLAANALAAADSCGPAKAAGRWGGTYACAGSAKSDGRADIRVQQKGNGFLAKYSVTERNAKGQTFTTSATTPLTPDGTVAGRYRATFKLDPRNIFRVQSIPVILTFRKDKAGRCVVFHQADLGSFNAMGSIKGSSVLEKKKVSWVNDTASPVFSQKCSGRLAPVAEEEE